MRERLPADLTVALDEGSGHDVTPSSRRAARARAAAPAPTGRRARRAAHPERDRSAAPAVPGSVPPDDADRGPVAPDAPSGRRAQRARRSEDATSRRWLRREAHQTDQTDQTTRAQRRRSEPPDPLPDLRAASPATRRGARTGSATQVLVAVPGTFGRSTSRSARRAAANPPVGTVGTSPAVDEDVTTELTVVDVDVDVDGDGPAGADGSSTRSVVRSQRARRRRAQQARGVLAAGLAAAGVCGALISADQLPLPGVDQVQTIDDTRAMSPLQDLEHRTRSDLSTGRRPWSPSPSASSSPSPQSSTTSSPRSSTKSPTTSSATRSATTQRSTRKSTATSSGRAGTTSSRSSSAAGSNRPGVKLDGRRMGGWYGGASGTGVADGGLSSWLNQPVTLAAFWADTSDEVQRTVPSLTSEYRNWDKAVDIAVGGTVLGSGENYNAAANGAYDDRWRAAAKVIASNRKGAKGPTFVRPFHEMNGSWYANWIVTRENSADYKRAFARYARILREELPEVYITFSPNYGDHTGLPIEYWYPGDDVVDVIAPDYYNDYQDQANGSVSGWNAEAGKKDRNGNPVGPEAWRQFAAKHGKPLGFPEWGIKPSGAGGADSAAWIKAFNAWMNKNANTATWQVGERTPKGAAGKVLYSAYFNVVHGGDAGFTVYGHGANPNASSAFKGLRWGNQN